MMWSVSLEYLYIDIYVDADVDACKPRVRVGLEGGQHRALGWWRD